MLTLGWILGMGANDGVRWYEVQQHLCCPRPRFLRWFLSGQNLAVKVFGLGLMEIWRINWKHSAFLQGPGRWLPHTVLAAFVLGYFCDSVASRVLASFRAQPPAGKV